MVDPAFHDSDDPADLPLFAPAPAARPGSGPPGRGSPTCSRSRRIGGRYQASGTPPRRCHIVATCCSKGEVVERGDRLAEEGPVLRQVRVGGRHELKRTAGGRDSSIGWPDWFLVLRKAS
jgi:hypothetical protein